MAYNPIKKLFDDSNKSSVPFNWLEHGVDNKYCILFTGRTGSTLLTKLLAQTGLCGTPDEFFNEGLIPHILANLPDNGFDSYLSHIVLKYKSNRYFGIEIDAVRFGYLQQFVDLDGEIFNFKKTRLIWLTRQDILSQAYSFTHAKVSGVWHVFEGGNEIKGTAPYQGVDVSEELIWANVIQVLVSEQQMERYLTENNLYPLRITYEQLILERSTTIRKILSQIGILQSIPDDILKASYEPTQKMQYKNKEDVLIRFYQKYGEVLNRIESERRTINSNEIISLLKRDYGCDISK